MLMLTPKQAGGNDPEFMAQLNPNNQKFGIKIKTDEEVVITSYSIHYTKLYDNE